MATQRQARRAIDIHEDELVEYPNVVGLGVVPVKQKKGSKERAVAVYVAKKIPRSELGPDERIPRTLKIPARKGNHKVPIRIIETGDFYLEEKGRFGIESV